MKLLANVLGTRIEAHRLCPRIVVSNDEWILASDGLHNGAYTLAGLWGEWDAVHMALLDETMSMAVISLHCADGHFPSVARAHAPAIRLERTVQDLFGLVADDTPDGRPWLDHGRWGLTHPHGHESKPVAGGPYPFLPAEGESLHRIGVGPVHAGIIEPGHFRFTANGETVVRLEERLGYTHKGIEWLMAGADLDTAARLSGRVSGDSTVAYAIAFARAVETALATEAPPRAQWLRALMAEFERLANHLGDIGAICNDASFALMLAHCGILRERVLRLADGCFGHRLMRDCIVPGGVAVDLAVQNVPGLHAFLNELDKQFDELIELYDNTASLQDRVVGTGILQPALARQFGAGGFVGRASGRNFDTRRDIPYPPYDELTFDVPVLTEGDVNARVWVRIREVKQSIGLVRQILNRLPGGAMRVELPRYPGEGLAMVEGFRGDILVWLRLDHEHRVIRCHLRDPSWFQWPLLEAAIEGNIVADFPLCNKSFNGSYSGHDL